MPHRFEDNAFLSLLLTGKAPDVAGPRLRHSFDRFDTDCDGALDASELESLLERRGGGKGWQGEQHQRDGGSVAGRADCIKADSRCQKARCSCRCTVAAVTDAM